MDECKFCLETRRHSGQEAELSPIGLWFSSDFSFSLFFSRPMEPGTEFMTI
jgi:hypothetical protein